MEKPPRQIGHSNPVLAASLQDGIDCDDMPPLHIRTRMLDDYKVEQDSDEEIAHVAPNTDDTTEKLRQLARD